MFILDKPIEIVGMSERASPDVELVHWLTAADSTQGVFKAFGWVIERFAVESTYIREDSFAGVIIAAGGTENGSMP